MHVYMHLAFKELTEDSCSTRSHSETYNITRAQMDLTYLISLSDEMQSVIVTTQK